MSIHLVDLPMMANIERPNRVMMADSYKYSHTMQYPDNTVGMFDYAEARSGKVYDRTLFNGLQPKLMKYFTTPIEQWEVDEAADYAEFHGVSFNKEGWDYIVQELGGWLPVVIRAVPEGTIVPVQNALFTIESTDKKVYWIASWLETVLMTIWYPCNVATRSLYVRELLEEFAEISQDTPFVAYQYHNFGARGSANPEAAIEGGMAHLAAGFFGSDNFSAMREVVRFYGPDFAGMSEEEAILALREFKARIMHSINATEHSSTTAWTRENEIAMIMNHLEKNKGKAIIAAVMDSFDYFNAVNVVCKKDGEFQNKINSDEYPIFVMRPDSGDPTEMVNGTLDIMEEQEIPFIVNKKGFKVFNKMRIIWGDGINMEAMRIMAKILISRGYSSENIAFGSGGWLMQQHDRDTQGWAVKCSEITLDEGSAVDTGNLPGEGPVTEWEECLVTRDVYKDPVTAPNKKSKKGKMTLWYDKDEDKYFTGGTDMIWPESFNIIDAMFEVFRAGKMIKTYSMDDLRENSKGKI